MPRYAHADVLDGGLNALKSGADKMWLLKGYAALDNFAAVSGNKIAEVSMDNTDPTTDYVISGANGAARVLTTATKSAPATGNSSGGDLHIALIDSVGSRVLYVTDETSNQEVYSGNTVNFPAVVYTAGQPVAP